MSTSLSAAQEPPSSTGSGGTTRTRRQRLKRLQNPECFCCKGSTSFSGLKGRLRTGHEPAPSHHLYIVPCCLHNNHAITIILPREACVPCWKCAPFIQFQISSGCKKTNKRERTRFFLTLVDTHTQQLWSLTHKYYLFNNLYDCTSIQFMLYVSCTSWEFFCVAFYHHHFSGVAISTSCIHFPKNVSHVSWMCWKLLEEIIPN